MTVYFTEIGPKPEFPRNENLPQFRIHFVDGQMQHCRLIPFYISIADAFLCHLEAVLGFFVELFKVFKMILLTDNSSEHIIGSTRLDCYNINSIKAINQDFFNERVPKSYFHRMNSVGFLTAIMHPDFKHLNWYSCVYYVISLVYKIT